MTDYAKIANTLRRYANGINEASRGIFKVREAEVFNSAADAIDQLVQIHQLDLSELVRLRRQIQALLEDRSAEHCSAEEAAHA